MSANKRERLEIYYEMNEEDQSIDDSNEIFDFQFRWNILSTI